MVGVSYDVTTTVVTVTAYGGEACFYADGIPEALKALREDRSVLKGGFSDLVIRPEDARFLHRELGHVYSRHVAYEQCRLLCRESESV